MCKGIKPWPQFGKERAGGVFGGWCPVTLAPKERENSRIQGALANLPRLQGQTLRFPGQLELA